MQRYNYNFIFTIIDSGLSDFVQCSVLAQCLDPRTLRVTSLLRLLERVFHVVEQSSG